MQFIHTLNKNKRNTLFLPPFFMSWTQRSKTFFMYTKGLFLSNIVHKSVLVSTSPLPRESIHLTGVSYQDAD